MRAIGRAGPPAVSPIRGSMRVGSEGLMAFLASQGSESRAKIVMNHPGPDRIRAKSGPAGEIVLLTDFIGSGTRIRTMLDKFWRVASIRSWVSLGLVRFRVVSAAATKIGIAKVRSHRLRPEVITEWITPAVDWETSSTWYFKWADLISRYGPVGGRGAGRYGFGGNAALVAFSYRLPNNTPAIVHQSGGGWRALYDGPIPSSLNQLFGVRSASQIVDRAAEDNGIGLPPFLTEEERKMVLVLRLMRGRWRRGAEVALAGRTGMAVPAVMEVVLSALGKGLITNTGRVTDKGYALLEAAGPDKGGPHIIATASKPYYPEALRVPR